MCRSQCIQILLLFYAHYPSKSNHSTTICAVRLYINVSRLPISDSLSRFWAMNQEPDEPLPCPVPSPPAIVFLGWGETPWARSAYPGQPVWVMLLKNPGSQSWQIITVDRTDHQLLLFVNASIQNPTHLLNFSILGAVCF